MSSKRENRYEAQSRLMAAMQAAFLALEDEGLRAGDDEYDETVHQFRRVEKLFGYDRGSWGLG